MLLSVNIQTWARTRPWDAQTWAWACPPPQTLPQPLDPLVQPLLCTLPRDAEIQEDQFLDKEDWGARRTSQEISHLHNDCMR